MFSRKLLGIHKSTLLRLGPCISTSKKARNCKYILTVASCPYYSSASSANELLFQENKNSYENNHHHSHQHSKHKRNFDLKVGSILSAIIVFLLGIQEAFCDPPVQEDELLPKADTSTTNSSRSNDSSKDKRSESSSKPNHNDKEKVHKNGKSLPDLPTRKNPNDTLKEKALPSLPSSKFKEPLLNSSVLSLKTAIDKSRSYLNCKLSESGAPGIAISVSVNGKLVWSEGIGLSDAENGVRMSAFSVMRIASISKSLTMVAICQLIEEGKLDLDAPVQKYVPSFPKKFVDGEEVTITTRHLLNHTSGIRHYELKSEERKLKKKRQKEEEERKEIEEEEEEEASPKNGNTSEEKEEDPVVEMKKKRKKTAELLSRLAVRPREEKDDDREFQLEEYYIKETFKNIKEALKLFQDDELLFKPGEDYNYTTHGFTLVSAVIEGASGKKFSALMLKLLRDMAMTKTTLDQNDPIIIRRARMYRRDKQGKLKNAPYVDNSYKWAGGGFLSNVIDLNNFGNVMLYSYQNTEDKEPKGFLKASTVRDIWKSSPNTQIVWDPDGAYGLGWGVVQEEEHPKAFAYRRRFYASHTGGAVGASSVLLIMPTCGQNEVDAEDDPPRKEALPQGVVVAIITNLQEVGLNGVALEIAKLFERVQQEDNSVLGTIGGNTKNKVYSLDTS